MRTFPAATLCAVLLLGQFSAAQASQAATPGAEATSAWQVRSEPATLVNGAPAVLYVAPPVKLQALGGSWMGHKIFFSFDSGSGCWYALFGVGLNALQGGPALAQSHATTMLGTIRYTPATTIPTRSKICMAHSKT